MSKASREEEIGKIQDRTRRLTSELMYSQRVDLGGGRRYDIEVKDDADIGVWTVRLHASNFPDDTALHQDLLEAPKHLKTDHIEVEIRFPAMYPREPPFFRVVAPRFVWHTGHVSWGGSICLESLVNTGTDRGYQQTFTVAGLLTMVVHNLTQDNPPANVSQGRLDFKRDRSPERTSYDLEEAKKHFRRIVSQHGWNAHAPQAVPLPTCKYAPKCYRKNPDHWKEFSHPGQPDPPA